MFAQIYEALKTGGIGARLPIAQQGVEQSRAATSTAMTGTQESLSRSGLLKTPWGQSTLAGVRQSGEQATNRIPTDIAQQFISLAPNFLSSVLGTQMGGASNLAQVDASREAAMMQMLASLYGSTAGMFSFGGGGTLGAGGTAPPLPVG